jgi:glutamate synthase domain-containing protein 3
MSGGEIVVRPFSKGGVIAGNALLYGATGGVVFIAGAAGERFAVRNSGALAVVEGVGDHACEYMTGGVVVILGPYGRNLAAGMTGGVAYVFASEGSLSRSLNPEHVGEEDLTGDELLWLQDLVRAHVRLTGSAKGRKILGEWSPSLLRRLRPREGGLPVLPSLGTRRYTAAALESPCASSRR